MTVAVVSLAAVTKCYPGSGVVLKGITLTVAAGERVAIVGPSGSGKSTLLHVIGTLERFDGGTVVVDGHDLGSMTDGELADLRARSIGFVFQQFFLLDALTARENVEQGLLYSPVPARERTERAAEALAAVGLAHRELHRPPQLSGGERQRVAIARAIVHRPAFLLADEPTGNLDSRSGAEVLSLLCSISDGDSAVIVVTHDPLIAAELDRSITVRDGLIVAA